MEQDTVNTNKKLDLTNDQLEIIEDAIRATFKQGKRAGSVDEEGNFGCLYRGDEGTKCLLGHMIPDSEYKGSFDEQVVGVSYVIAAVPTLSFVFTGDVTYRTRNQLEILQGCHDGATGGNFKLGLIINIKDNIEKGLLSKQLNKVVDELKKEYEAS